MSFYSLTSFSFDWTTNPLTYFNFNHHVSSCNDGSMLYSFICSVTKSSSGIMYFWVFFIFLQIIMNHWFVQTFVKQEFCNFANSKITKLTKRRISYAKSVIFSFSSNPQPKEVIFFSKIENCSIGKQNTAMFFFINKRFSFF